MFSLMLHKLLHKKWMVLCLLIGNILLISVAASYPLYRVSSFQKMLTDEFDNYREEENCWPAVFSVTYSTLKGGGKTGFSTMETEAFQAAEQLDLDMLDTVTAYRLGTQRATPAVVRDDETGKRLTLSAISGMQEHVEILYGRYPADETDSDGFLEIMVSDEAMVEQDILLETIIQGSDIRNPREMAHHVLEQVLAWTGKEPADDMTVLAVGIWREQ